MILIDTHIWLWWVNEGEQLSDVERSFLDDADSVAVSAISCWEISLLVSLERLELSQPVLDWLNTSLRFPNIQLLPISPEVAVEANNLPGDFHKDPADRLIVASARVHDAELFTSDSRIQHYSHVKLAKP